MTKKWVLILLVLFMTGFAKDYLVRVELTGDRLTPLFDKGLRIIAELDHCALLLMDNAEFNKITTYSHQILDNDAQAGLYYLVHPLNKNIDLQKYGQILTHDGDDFLIKIKQEKFEDLIKEKVMVRWLSLRPIIEKREAQTIQFRSDPIVQEIVDKVNPDSILSYVRRLQNFVTRFSTHDSCFRAADYIASKFAAFGCDSVFFQDHTGGFAPNVIGVKRGVVYPDSIYAVICGHFDATSNMEPDIAPGADDNASGTSGAIEAARVMKDYDFNHSIRFIAFSGEEQGLYGSEYYAAIARANGDSILGVFNGDMIAYVDQLPESLEVIAKISNPPCEPFADFFIAAADTYTTLITRKNMVASASYSDHAPFWDNSYLALCLIEDMWPVNPYYHETGDTIGAGYNNNEFCTEVVKAEVAALATIVETYHDPGVDEFEKSTTHNVSLAVYPSVSKGPFTISYVLNESKAKVTLNIYDVTGTLVKSFSQPSPIIWNGTDDSGHKLAAGVYLLRIEPDQVDATAKLILLR